MIDNIIYRNGEPVSSLNPRLIVQQGLSQADVDRLKELHLERMSIEQQLAQASRPEEIKTIFGWWTDNQFALQRTWGFPEDANWHPSHRLPHCTCPKLDNDDSMGTPHKVITKGCPIHDV